MADSFASALLANVAQRLEECGVHVDIADLDALFVRAFERYHDDLEFGSTDTMPTSAQLHHSAADLAARLEDVVQRLAAAPHLLQWLGEFSPERSAAACVDRLKACARIASDAEKYFAEHRTEPLIVTGLDGTEHTHQRRSRTASRDRVLIPWLVGVLGILGLQLRSGDEWDREALDVACDVIELVLAARGIDAPDKGRPEHGEARQGRLRRIIKAASRTLTNSDPPKTR